MTVEDGVAPPSASRRARLRAAVAAAFAGAAGALVAAIAGGITEPTGIATVMAVIATVVGYGLAPLALAVAMRLAGVSSSWVVAAALFAAALWLAAGLVLVAPALIDNAPAAVGALISSAPTASALWLLVASVEVVRAGMPRWSLVFVGVFVAVLIVGSVLIELSGFDIRRVLVPFGWAAWMIDLSAGLRGRLTPSTPRSAVPAAATSSCANCGAPRRTDGLAFCSDCGLPYRS